MRSYQKRNTPQFYEIRIEGHIDEERSHGLSGMSITLLPNGHTQITGYVVDQAALFGILIRIRDMGIPLVSVMRTDNSYLVKKE